MAKKKEVVPFKDIQDALKNDQKSESVATWNDINIVVKRRVSIEDMSAFVSEVSAACFDKENEFHPEFREFLFKLGVITYFTNINLPKSSAKQFEVVYADGLYSTIERHIDEDLLYDIDCAISRKIDYLVKKQVEAINKKLIDQFSSMEGFINQLSGMFDGVTDEDLKRLMDAMPEDGFDEKKIVEAVLDHQERKNR